MRTPTIDNVTLDGQVTSYAAGESFALLGDSSFDIDVIETVSYVCHDG